MAINLWQHDKQIAESPRANKFVKALTIYEDTVVDTLLSVG